MGWTLVVAAVVLAALLGGWVIAKTRPRTAGTPVAAPPDETAPYETAPYETARYESALDETALDETAAEAEAEAVRAAAERAVVAADEARHRAEYAEQLTEEAEQRYLAAQWEARSAAGNESDRLVQRAALDAYRRGDLNVTQLNTIWEHATASTVEPDPGRVDTARDEYDRALAATARVRQEAHVAEVAAEALVEETRIAASERPRTGLDDLLR
ncbi:hypothetical protein AB0F72_05780 [Actinoplanes sp. NPDC023936]|uniref:hypothetical protein n=1 Tax=Actinoplanes sp. NPDC023936 TaxID=3154910 RepID=UPI0033E9D7D1